MLLTLRYLDDILNIHYIFFDILIKRIPLIPKPRFWICTSPLLMLQKG